MTSWRWIGSEVAYSIHERQLSEHGGLDGVRDANAVESALARPQNLAVYENPDAAALAASCAFGIARSHGFADGNKRTAWVLARLFLADNGYSLRFERVNAIEVMLKVAAGTVAEEQLATWFRERIHPQTE